LLLGVAYSFPIPGYKGKGIRLLSSLLHVAGSLLTFLLGYALFSPIDWRALLVGGYFGLIISAGHLVQEIQDVEGDRAADIATLAVTIGRRQAFLLAFLLFTLSFGYLYGLAALGHLPPLAAYLLVFYPVLCLLAIGTWRRGLDPVRVGRFRSSYRLLFGVLVLLLASAGLAQALA